MSSTSIKYSAFSIETENLEVHLASACARLLSRLVCALLCSPFPPWNDDVSLTTRDKYRFSRLRQDKNGCNLRTSSNLKSRTSILPSNASAHGWRSMIEKFSFLARSTVGSNPLFVTFTGKIGRVFSFSRALREGEKLLICQMRLFTSLTVSFELTTRLSSSTSIPRSGILTLSVPTKKSFRSSY